MFNSVASSLPVAIGGTSVSSPIVAGLIALLNEASVKASGKPLGFIAPLFYQAFAAGGAKYFTDITEGSNVCVDNGCLKGCAGFQASAGWDPVSGLGSLNYGGLESYIAAMLAERAQTFGEQLSEQ